MFAGGIVHHLVKRDGDDRPGCVGRGSSDCRSAGTGLALSFDYCPAKLTSTPPSVAVIPVPV